MLAEKSAQKSKRCKRKKNEANYQMEMMTFLTVRVVRAKIRTAWTSKPKYTTKSPTTITQAIFKSVIWWLNQCLNAFDGI